MRKILTVAVLCLGIAGLGAGVAAATSDLGTNTSEEEFVPPFLAP